MERAVVESQATMRSSYGGMGILGGKYSFGPFEVNTGARELSKHGTKVKLRGQPYLILEVLLGRAGEVVTRMRSERDSGQLTRSSISNMGSTLRLRSFGKCFAIPPSNHATSRLCRVWATALSPRSKLSRKGLSRQPKHRFFLARNLGRPSGGAAGLDPQNPRPRQDPGIASETVQQEQVSRSGPWQSLSPRWLLAAGLVALLLGAAYVRLDRGSQTKRLVRRETPRLCRGGSRSLTDTGVHRGNSQT